jgi:hypothetical protein
MAATYLEQQISADWRREYKPGPDGSMQKGEGLMCPGLFGEEDELRLQTKWWRWMRGEGEGKGEGRPSA